MTDIRQMQLGQVVDFIISYNERNKEVTSEQPKKKKIRRMTQAEIDAFLG